MFMTIIPGQLKIVALMLIGIFLVGLLGPPLLLWARGFIHQLFQKVVAALLKGQTRTYETLVSEHFILKYTTADQDWAPAIMPLAEDYLAKVTKIIAVEERLHRIPLVLYPSTAEMNKNFAWSGDKSAVGVYWAGTIRLLSPFAWQNKVSEPWLLFQREGPLAHELTHLLVDQVTRGNYPRWLTEGLAQYVEREITGFALTVPTVEQQKNPYPFAALGTGFDRQEDQFLAYWQSLCLVEDLLAQYGPECLWELLAQLQQGQKFAGAFRSCYGVSFAQFEKEWRQKLKD